MVHFPIVFHPELRPELSFAYIPVCLTPVNVAEDLMFHLTVRLLPEDATVVMPQMTVPCEFEIVPGVAGLQLSGSRAVPASLKRKILF